MAQRYQGGVLGVGFNPIQAPNPPTIGTATAGNASVSVAFTAPTNVGGSAITSYRVLATPGAIGASGTSSPINVTGLTNDVSYTFSVAAVNSYGFSQYSGTATAQPYALYIEELFSTYLYTGNGGTQTITNGIALGGAATESWVASIDGVYPGATNVAVDSDGNTYTAGYFTLTGLNVDNKGLLVKYNSAGVLQWQRSIATNSPPYTFGLGVGSDGSIVVSGYLGNAKGFVVKYDSSGTIVWQRLIEGAGTYLTSAAIDASGNVYIAGDGGSSGTLFKYDSSGTVVWKKNIGTGNFNDIKIDGDGNILVAASATISSAYKILLIKFSPAGSIVWQRQFGDGQFNFANSVAVDSQNNVYIGAQTRSGSGLYDGLIAKFNSSGTVQWTRTLALNGTGQVAVDPSGNAYFGTSFGVISKFNTSGALLWQRTWATAINKIVAPSSGIRVVGLFSNVIVTARLPLDGSGLGTYTVGAYNMTYGGTLQYLTTVSLSAPASSLSLYTSDLTSSDTTFTAATPTLTAVTTTIPLNAKVKGGLVWIKQRGGPDSHQLRDTMRGNNWLATNTANPAQPSSTSDGTITSYNSNGFTLGTSGGNQTPNGLNRTMASWTFAKFQRFFDVVTWSGNGSSSQTIPHSLGVAPGMIMVKRVDDITTGDWYVYHRGQTSADSKYLVMNSTAAAVSTSNVWNTSSTSFTASSTLALNSNSATYVAYLFAHDTASDGVIQCGSFSSTGQVTLGWEPQWVLIKSTTDTATYTGDWRMFDNMRGVFADLDDYQLFPSNSFAENSGNYGTALSFNPTGFNVESQGSYGTSTIYVAIRRGPMQPPTAATNVFSITQRTGTSANATVSGAVVTDLSMTKALGASTGAVWGTRLIGQPYNRSDWDLGQQTNAAVLPTNPFDVQTGFKVGTSGANTNDQSTNNSGTSYINYMFSRAPQFLEIVRYTGNGSIVRSIPHNLTVAPGIMFVKNLTDGSDSWVVQSSYLGGTQRLELGSNGATGPVTNNTWANTAATSTDFTVSNFSVVNRAGTGYAAYLFGNCPGVSKVGNYTGNGSSQNIDCGFPSSARFVIIKRVDASGGSWFVFDSVRGMSAGNDPFFQLQFNGPQTTGFDIVNTFATGFTVTQESTYNANVNGVPYIYLAIS